MNLTKFDLSDRMAKGVNDQGNIVTGAIIEGSIAGNNKNIASGENSHAEGLRTTASGNASHSEGFGTISSGSTSHTEGSSTQALGSHSHAEGQGTIAKHSSQHVFGEYNIEDPSIAVSTAKGNYIEIVGNGTADNARSNVRTLDWSGNEKLAGSLTLGMGTANETTITAAQLSALLALSTAEGVTF